MGNLRLGSTDVRQCEPQATPEALRFPKTPSLFVPPFGRVGRMRGCEDARMRGYWVGGCEDIGWGDARILGGRMRGYWCVGINIGNLIDE
jgi:hypothetical protein